MCSSSPECEAGRQEKENRHSLSQYLFAKNRDTIARETPKHKANTGFKSVRNETNPASKIAKILFDRKPKSSNLTIRKQPNFMADMNRILVVLENRKMRKLLFFVGLIMFTPSFSSTWNYYFTSIIGLQPEDLGEINFISSVGYLIGILAMNTIFKNINFRSFYVGTSLVSSVLLCSGLILLFDVHVYLGVPAKLFCVINSLISNFVNELNILPILALCSRFSPSNLEAMSYSVFMSIFWISFYVSQVFGVSILYFFGVSQDDFSNFSYCVMFQAGYGLVISIIIFFVDLPNEFDEIVAFMKGNTFCFIIYFGDYLYA